MNLRRFHPRRWPSPAQIVAGLRERRFEDFGLKLLALLLAMLLFAVSRQPVSDIRLVGVPLEFRDLKPGLEISGDVEQTVSVRLRGPRDAVRSLTPNQLSVVADLSTKEPGERVIQLKPDDVSRPDNIEVTRIDPSSIGIRIEPTMRKHVAVEPRLLGSPASGFEVYDVSLAPQTVELEGARAEVEEVDRVPTETVRLDGRAQSFETLADVEPPSHSVRVLTPGPVRIAVTVGERRVAQRVTRVPVAWVDRPEGASLLTREVTVELYGPRSALEALAADGLRAELRTADLPGPARSAPAQVRLPDGADARIEVRGVSPAEVKFKR